MKDWMDKAYNEFRSEHLGEISVMSPLDVQMLKEAWLHGARTSLAQARVAVDEFMTATKDVQP